MRKIVWILMLLVMVSSVSASWKYKTFDSVNVSVVPGGAAGGYFHFNYTKLAPSNSDLLWQVNYSNNIFNNFTILQSCWDTYPDKVAFQIRTESLNVANDDFAWLYCWNGSWYNFNYSFQFDNAQTYGVGTENLAFDGDYSTSVLFDAESTSFKSCASGGCLWSRIAEQGTYWETTKVSYYNMELFNLSSNDLVFDSWFDNDATFNGYPLNPGTLEGSIVHNATGGKFGGAYEFDGVNDYANLISSTEDLTQFTVSYWMNPNLDVVTTRVPIFGDNPTFDNWIGYYMTAPGDYYMWMEFKDGTPKWSGIPLITAGWQHLGHTFDGLNVSFYRNGVYISEVDAAGLNISIKLLGKGYSSVYFNGTLDNVQIYNRSLSSAEILNIYQNSSKYGSPIGQDLIASYVFEDDYDNTTHTMDTNMMVKGTNETFDGLGAMTFDGVDDYVDTGTILLDSFTEMTQSLWFKTDDLAVNRYFTAEKFIQFYISSVGQITVNGRNTTASQIVTTSSAYDNEQWHMATWVYSEISGNQSIYIDGSLIITDYITGELDSAGTDFRFGSDRSGNNVMNGSIDEVKILEVALNQSQVYDLYTYNNITYSEFEINITSPLASQAQPMEDNPIVFNYDITTVTPVNCSLIKGGTVINRSGINLSAGSYTITDSNPTIGSIAYQLLCNKTYLEETDNETISVRWSNFNISITAPASGSLYDTNASLNFTYLIANNDTSNLRVNCSLIRDSTVINTGSNLQAGTRSLQDLLTLNGTHFYNVSCSSPGRTNVSQTINVTWDNVIRLIPCGTLTNQTAINFTIFESINSSELNGTIQGHFTIVQYNVSETRTQNLSFNSNVSGDNLCIYPESANTTFSAQIQYTAPTYDTFTYYYEDSNLDNVTDQVPLYMTPAALTTLVQFTVTDQNDNPISNVLIHVLKYDLATDSSINTEILRTDNAGQDLGHIILNTQRYRYLLIYNGEVVLFTSPIILTLTSYTFRINLDQDYFENFNIVQDVVCTTTFTNASRRFEFVYADTVGATTQGCLKVVQQNYYGEVILVDNCTTSSSGTIAYVIPPSTGAFTYKGIGYIKIGGTHFVCGDHASFRDDVTYKVWGDAGLLASFFLTLTLILVGVWSPVVAVALMALGILLSIIMGIFSLSPTVLVPFIIGTGVVMYRVAKR